MKFKLTLNKVFEIDTDRDWGGDTAQILDALRENGVEGEANSDDIRDALCTMLSNNVESVVELSDLDENDFKIEVDADTTIDVPKDESDDAED